MYDANLRGLPKGYMFFSEVFGVDKNSDLFLFGVRKGDILLGKMLTSGIEDVTVLFLVKDKFIKLTETLTRNSLFVFVGALSGHSFISEEHINKSLEVLSNSSIKLFGDYNEKPID